MYTVERTSDFSIIGGKEREDIISVVGPLVSAVTAAGGYNFMRGLPTDEKVNRELDTILGNLVLRDDMHVRAFTDGDARIRKIVSKFSVAYEKTEGYVVRVISIFCAMDGRNNTYETHVTSVRGMDIADSFDERYRKFFTTSKDGYTFLSVEY